MEKKKIIYLLGGLALAGVVYYLYKQKKEAGDDDSSKEDGDLKIPDGEPKWKKGVKMIKPTSSKPNVSTGETTTKETASLSKEERRKQEKSDSKKYALDCGKKPMFKKKRAEWQKCVDRMKAGGYGFDGYISHSNFNEMDDFTNELDI